MIELTDDSCRPVYKNELSNFKKETLEKVKEFRAARDNWITTHSNQIANTSTTEGLYKADEYKGRCALLRRIRFKTTFLRVHHKTLRPLKFYTFKRKLSDTEIERIINESLEKSRICTEKHAKLRKNLAPVECLQEKSGKKGKSKRRNKNDNFIMKKISSRKNATKKLKAPKLERRLVDSCKCEGKKGLTVVIKGVCLCDKTALNKLTLGQVCDEYCKMERKNTKPAESNLTHATDSLELYKKKMSQYPLEKVEEVKENAITPSESMSNKHVKFNHDRDAEVKRKLIIKDDKISKPKSASINIKSTETPVIKCNGFKDECTQKTVKEKGDQSSDKNKTLESHTKKNPIPDQKKVTEDFLKAKPTEEKTETGNSNESTITLYKNKEQESSDFGLTKEQRQKMQKIPKQKNEK